MSYQGTGVSRKPCEVCGKMFTPVREGQKYHSPKCGQWAWRNRKRVEAKAKRYGLTADELSDLEQIAKVSGMAADAVKEVSSLAGRDLALRVLDGLWDMAARMGVFDYGAVRVENAKR